MISVKLSKRGERKMSNNISNVKHCCGCLVCEQICPKKTISVQTKNGYIYPDIKGCVDCGTCLEVCPVLNCEKIKHEATEKVYIAKNKKTDIRKRSTSGGMFTLFAEKIIDNGGIVYGAAYDESMTVRHLRAEKYEDIKKFQGSKYVQSDISNVLPQIADDLKHGKTCLFSGTPCQVAAVILFCGKITDLKNLITLEILCYGVPSPEVFEEHIALIQKTYKKRVKKYCFRDQREGCSQLYLHSAVLEDGNPLYREKILIGLEELYRAHFNVRESCFECKFIGKHRCADITLGDCWGISNINSEFADNIGVSQVLVNTETGRELWENVKGEVDYFVTELDSIIDYNGVYLSGPQKPREYKSFWKYYNNKGYKKTLKNYTSYGGIQFKVKRKIRRLLKKFR